MIQNGHTLDSIFHAQQPGVPYRGWTIVQLRFFSERAVRHHSEGIAEHVEAVLMGVAAAMGKKANRTVRAALRKLRGSRRDG